MPRKKISTEDFVRKAKNIHGDKYNYSKVDYIKSNISVVIKCPEHGFFKQIPNSHLMGHGCKLCANALSASKRVSNKEQYILKAKKVHGDKYDYSKAIYKNFHTKIAIRCPEHGLFKQTPANHLNYGCNLCGNVLTSSKQIDSVEEFILKAKMAHGDKYDYSEVEYKNTKTKIEIRCPEHGLFKQTPGSHLSGKGCKRCAHNFLSSRFSATEEEFILKAKMVHGDKYDYSEVEYKNALTRIVIRCPEHGLFKQTPGSHTYGSGCKKCGYEKIGLKNRSNKEKFTLNAKKVHGGKYNYSEVFYVTGRIEVMIECPKHGFFFQIPQNHLNGAGCNRCINKSEGKIAEYLKRKHIVYRSFRINDQRKHFDFYLPKYNQLIERDGEQHYMEKAFTKEISLADQQRNDKYKTKLAKKNGYKIARIPYWLNEKQVEREINNILTGKPTYPEVPDLKQAKTKPLPK